MVKAKTVTDEMFIAAAKGLADYVGPEQIKKGNIYPRMEELRNISATVSPNAIQTIDSCQVCDCSCWSSIAEDFHLNAQGLISIALCRCEAQALVCAKPCCAC